MMAIPICTQAWILRNKPGGLPSIGGPKPTFVLETINLPPLESGQVLVESLYLSNDPAQRGWIDARLPGDRNYVVPVEIGQVMRARGLGRVIKSLSTKIPIGTIIRGNVNWSEYSVIDETAAYVLQPLPQGLELTTYLGALGNTGLTAYYGLVVIAEASKSDKIVVSGAAGATGSMVVQIAKKIVGAPSVIGIAGSDEKCNWVKQLGADECLNYKSPSFHEDLRDATASGVDLYYDNVGGDILDLMIGRMSKNGRIAACGAITGYNSEEPCVLKNYFQIISMRLQIRGFIVLDFQMDKAMEAQELLSRAIADGRLRIDSSNETVVPTDFKDVPATWLRLFSGHNVGKLVTALKI